MNKSESIAQLAPALIALQAELSPVAKTAENPFFKSHYADLTSIWQAVQPILATHGFAVTQVGSPCEPGNVAVETMLIHTSGEWISGELTLPVGKADPQGAGSAISYARRYGLSAILSLVTEDDDGEAASKPFRAPTAQAPLQQATTPAVPSAGAAPQAAPAAPPPAAVSNAPLASEAQVRMMYAIANGANLNLTMLALADYHVEPEQLTKAQAGEFIDKLKVMATASGGQQHAAAAPPTGEAGATQPQLAAVAKIAAGSGITVSAMIEQEFPGVTGPEQLTKAQASHLIKKFGAKKD